MSLKSILLWAFVGLNGVGLLFNGLLRDEFYTQFSYFYTFNTKETQDLAEIMRIVVSLLMLLSLASFCKRILLRSIALTGFIIYTIILNQRNVVSIINKNFTDIQVSPLNIVIIFFCMDSVISEIIQIQIRSQRTKRFKQKYLQSEGALNNQNKQKGQTKTAQNEQKKGEQKSPKTKGESEQKGKGQTKKHQQNQASKNQKNQIKDNPAKKSKGSEENRESFE